MRERREIWAPLRLYLSFVYHRYICRAESPRRRRCGLRRVKRRHRERSPDSGCDVNGNAGDCAKKRKELAERVEAAISRWHGALRWQDLKPTV